MKKGYLALEITASRIRYVQLERHGRAHQIGCCGDIPHVFNFAAEGALSEAIAAIVAKENIRPERLFVSLCSQENFIRQMIIPRMSAHDLDAAIKGEIEKFPVFTRHAFDYIYHSSFFSRDKNNVVFAAVEDKILKYLFAECQHTGIPFQHLEITPLNFKELLPLFIKDDPDNQVVLIVDDHISYLMIVSGRQYRLIYQSGIGLDALYPDAKDVISEKKRV
jgi:Tfp pilus assembly PilM family ATPase